MAHSQRMTLSAQHFSFSSLASSLSILPSQSFTAEAWSLHSLGGLQQSLVREKETDLFLESCERFTSKVSKLQSTRWALVYITSLVVINSSMKVNSQDKICLSL